MQTRKIVKAIGFALGLATSFGATSAHANEYLNVTATPPQYLTINGTKYLCFSVMAPMSAQFDWCLPATDPAAAGMATIVANGFDRNKVVNVGGVNSNASGQDEAGGQDGSDQLAHTCLLATHHARWKLLLPRCGQLFHIWSKCQACLSTPITPVPRLLRKLRRTYAGQIEAATRIIARHFPPKTRVTTPSGGFVLWVVMPEGADAERVDGVTDGAVRRQRDDRHRRAHGARLPHDAAPIAVGELQVGDAEVERLRLDARDGLGARRRRDRLAAHRLDEPQETRVDRRIVVDEEDLLGHC